VRTAAPSFPSQAHARRNTGSVLVTCVDNRLHPVLRLEWHGDTTHGRCPWPAEQVVSAPALEGDHRIVVAGSRSAKRLIEHYADWSQRSLSGFDKRGALGSSRLRSLLFVAPEGHRMWDAVLTAVAAGALEAGPTLMFLPFRGSGELSHLLATGLLCAAAIQSGIRERAVTTLTSHARPYCGRIDHSAPYALCTSQEGGTRRCHGGNECAFQTTSVVPIERVVADVVFLNGCSTAVPPLSRLPYAPNALLGYRAFTSGCGLVLGNLGLGPAADWETQYIESTWSAEPQGLTAAMARLNALRNSHGCDRLFRVVSFGDAALWQGSSQPLAGATAVSRNTVTIVWPAHGAPTARIPQAFSSRDDTNWGIALRGSRGVDPAAVVCVREDSDSIWICAPPAPGFAKSRTVTLIRRRDRLPALARSVRYCRDGADELNRHSNDWQLGDISDALRTGERSLRTAVAMHRVRVPAERDISRLERFAERLLTGTCTVLMERLLDALRGSRIELSDIYEFSREAPRDLVTGSGTCPICHHASATIANRQLGRATAQLRCPLCAIVWQLPEALASVTVHARHVPRGTSVRFSVRNRADFDLAVAHVWHVEERLADGRVVYDRLDRKIRTAMIPAGEEWATHIVVPSRFLRLVRLYFVANAFIGFVQIRDFDPTRLVRANP
jgi:hypothetical protein